MNRPSKTTKVLIKAQIALLERNRLLALEIEFEARKANNSRTVRLIRESKNVVVFPGRVKK